MTTTTQTNETQPGGTVEIPVGAFTSLIALAKLCAAQDEGMVAESHHKLSALLEDEDAQNDDIRDAAIDVADTLNALQEHAKELLASLA